MHHPSGRDAFPELCSSELGNFGWEVREDVRAYQLISFLVDASGCCLVEVHDEPVGIKHHDQIMGRIEKSVSHFLTSEQLLLFLLAFGDVSTDDNEEFLMIIHCVSDVHLNRER